jgi:hypothetical protein
MRYHGPILLFAAISVLASPEVGFAQFWPGAYGYGGYGSWGGWGGRGAAEIEAASQARQLGQIRAMEQNKIVQEGIRNTLTTQAQSQTNSILNQRQANQDWWFQTQQQQAAQRKAGDGEEAPVAGGFGPVPPPNGFGGLAEIEASREVALDIIKWPTALQEKAFDTRRALIEAPYRRSPPRLSVPTADDYRDMVKTIEEMKTILEWRLQNGMITEDYEQAKAFLSKLGQEAQSRADGVSRHSEFELQGALVCNVF